MSDQGRASLSSVRARYALLAALALCVVALGATRVRADEPARRRTPSSVEVRTVLGGYAETVRPCGAGTAATVRVELTFEGQTGRVSELRANGATPAIHRCVENIVKDARLRPFDTPRFRVTFPYRVR